MDRTGQRLCGHFLLEGATKHGLFPPVVSDQNSPLASVHSQLPERGEGLRVLSFGAAQEPVLAREGQWGCADEWAKRSRCPARLHWLSAVPRGTLQASDTERQWSLRGPAAQEAPTFGGKQWFSPMPGLPHRDLVGGV